MSGSHIPAALRLLVYERGHRCCEYCLMPESATLASHEVDHVIARKHGGLTEEANLALSCPLCNKRKGSDLASIDPESGIVVPLFHPRRHYWSDHFKLENALIVPLTPEGRATVLLMQLNRADRAAERQVLIAARSIQIPQAEK